MQQSQRPIPNLRQSYSFVPDQPQIENDEYLIQGNLLRSHREQLEDSNFNCISVVAGALVAASCVARSSKRHRR